MRKLIIVAAILLCGTLMVKADDCKYWKSMVDPKAVAIDFNIDRNDQRTIINGIECLLKLEGRKGTGVLYGGREFVSQLIPKATVEINALYQISYLFHGHYDFANAVALYSDQDKQLVFNSKSVVRRAFKSYRIWFEKVKELGLEEARKQKLDPLAGSGVSWY